MDPLASSRIAAPTVIAIALPVTEGFWTTRNGNGDLLYDLTLSVGGASSRRHRRTETAQGARIEILTMLKQE